MSDAQDRRHTDEDAWATACAEDLAAERARRRELAGQQPGSAAEELRRLADAVGDKLAELRSPAAQVAAQAVISQVKAVGSQLRETSPGVFDHLAAAGSELLAAYRVAVSGQEQRWTRAAADPAAGPAGTAAHTAPDAPKDASGNGGGDRGKDGGKDGDGDGDGRPGTERIDLD